MSWSFFLKQKSEQVEKLIPFLVHLYAKDKKPVKFIRCDDAGENYKLEEKCKIKGLGIQFEYTAPGTPQRNGRVERQFATLYTKVRAMFDHSGIPMDMRKGLWCECANTAQKLHNILVSSKTPVPPYNQFYETNAPYLRALRTFGEIGVVTHYKNKQMRSKLDDRGRPCMFVGYPDNHVNDVYRMFDLQTEAIITTRDITWLSKMYGEYKGLTPIQVEDIDDDQLDAMDLSGTKRPNTVVYDIDYPEEAQSIAEQQTIDDGRDHGREDDQVMTPEVEVTLKLSHPSHPKLREH